MINGGGEYISHMHVVRVARVNSLELVVNSIELVVNALELLENSLELVVNSLEQVVGGVVIQELSHSML
jgi:hypothetical protein